MFKRKMGRKLISIAAVSTIAVGAIFGGFPQAEAEAKSWKPNQAKVKNVIFLIGDGMGPTYNTAYRYFKDDKSSPYMKKQHLMIIW